MAIHQVANEGSEQRRYLWAVKVCANVRVFEQVTEGLRVLLGVCSYPATTYPEGRRVRQRDRAPRPICCRDNVVDEYIYP